MSGDWGIVTHKLEQQTSTPVVSEADQWNWAHQKEEQNKQLVATLEAKGHVCVEVLETHPSQIRWCKQEPCLEKLKTFFYSSNFSENYLLFHAFNIATEYAPSALCQRGRREAMSPMAKSKSTFTPHCSASLHAASMDPPVAMTSSTMMAESN